MAQLVNHLTLDFGSVHDLMVHGIELHVRLCTISANLLEFSLSTSLSLSLSLSLSNIKFKK